MDLSLSNRLIRPQVPGLLTGYKANAVFADGVSDFLKATGLTVPTSTKCLVSAWLRSDTTAGFDGVLYGGNLGPASLLYLISGVPNMNNQKVGGGSANMNSSVTIDDGVWHHVAYSLDTELATSTWQFRVDEVERATSKQNTGAAEMRTNTDPWFVLGDDASLFGKFPGDVADVQAWIGVKLDLSVTDNRRLLITEDQTPADPALARAALGQPHFAFYGATDAWHKNRGSLGDVFAENGALTDSSALPVKVGT